MRPAVGMPAALSARTLLLTALVWIFSVASTVPAVAQTPLAGGEWGNSAGDAVAIKNGGFDVAITDATTSTSLFGSGRVVNRKLLDDGRTEFMLKPSGGKIDMYVVDVTADGATAEVFVVAGGDRHKAASLTK